MARPRLNLDPEAKQARRRAYLAAWRESHQAQIREQERRRIRTPEQQTAKNRAYYAKHPGIGLWGWIKTAAKREQVPLAWTCRADFEAALPRPPHGRLVRRVPALGFTPENCEWRITHARMDPAVWGKNIAALARQHRLSSFVLMKRLADGWSLTDALHDPPGPVPPLCSYFSPAIGRLTRWPSTLENAMKIDGLSLLDEYLVTCVGDQPNPKNLCQAALVGMTYMARLLGNLTTHHSPAEQTGPMISQLFEHAFQEGMAMDSLFEPLYIQGLQQIAPEWGDNPALTEDGGLYGDHY